MWKAIENAASLMNHAGLLYLALYTKTPKSEYWIKVKKRYNESSGFGKKIIEYTHMIRYLILPYLIKFKNPWKYMREYNQNRGMDYMTDIKDWLGGYPYEDAKIEEVFRFCRDKLKLELINIATGEANTEYLFKKINH
jgi:2-polyprenyl-6-hydroxyphenyl methylase/3-demethylubiquinone-9 3-methyltransferase